MARRTRTPVPRYDDAYPTLSEHREARGPSRRAFLATGLAAAGAGALVTGCPGFFGQVDGDIAEPTWARIRFPAEPDDHAVYLMDNGYARFYAVAVTWTEDVAMFAQDERAALLPRLAAVLAESTYDELNTPVGLDAAADRMRDELDAAYNENTGDVGEGWFEYVDLVLTRLDAPVEIGGVAPEPSFP